MIRCIALDDEPLSLSLIKEFASRIPYLVLTDTFTKPSKAGIFLKNNPCEMLFLDIQMPDINGLDFMRAAPPNTLVVFTTAFSDFAVEGFELNAIDYLLKPFSFERFKQATDKAFDYHTYIGSQQKGDYIFVYSEYNLLKIKLSTIEYIEGMGDYVQIHTNNSRPVFSLMTMKNLVDKLPDYFIRVHRSFILPVEKIKGTRGRNILTVFGKNIPIGDTYRDKIASLMH